MSDLVGYFAFMELLWTEKTWSDSSNLTAGNWELTYGLIGGQRRQRNATLNREAFAQMETFRNAVGPPR